MMRLMFLTALLIGSSAHAEPEKVQPELWDGMERIYQEPYIVPLPSDDVDVAFDLDVPKVPLTFAPGDTGFEQIELSLGEIE